VKIYAAWLAAMAGALFDQFTGGYQAADAVRAFLALATRARPVSALDGAACRPAAGAFATPAGPGVTALARGAPLWYKRLSMRSIGFPELLIIFGIAVLFFGSNKIPDLAKGLGEGIRNFKAAIKGDEPPKA
jgi:sec-independent protein translocase protein TatA